MRKSRKRWASLFLAFVILVALLPGNVFADEESEQPVPDPNAEVVVLETVTEYNPLYDNVFTHEQIDAMEEPSISKRGVVTANNTQYVTTLAEAGAQLRIGMKNCLTSFSVYFRETKRIFDEFGANIIENAIWDEAMKLTTDGREGDYLGKMWLKSNHTISYLISDDGYYVDLTVNYTFVYNTNTTYERQMVAYADELIGNFGFTSQTSSYDKIQTIYDYVISNIHYTADENVDIPLYHTAYSAIVLKDTVCQGYATLLYYMFWRCGIPCRYVYGNRHAWNLVWLRGQWYSLDATWDSSLGGAHDFFLRGRDTGFYGDGTNNTHVPENSTIIALVNNTSPYDYGNKRTADYGACITHTNAASTFITDDGCTCYWCSACGQSATGSFSTYRYIDGGYCGDNLYWTLDSNGCLQISGSGEMWDNQIVWYPHRNCVLSTELSGQMTSIGNRSFENTDYLPGVWLPMNLTRIGDSAFIGCDSLSWVVLPENIAQIEDNAFAYCSALTDVYYEGTPAQWNTITINSGNEYLKNAYRHYACSVNYDANGGTGEMSPNYWFTGLSITLDTNAFTRSGYILTGWNTAADGSGTSYADGASVTLWEDITLYAQWETPLSIRYSEKTVKASEPFRFSATGGTGVYTWRVGNTVVATVDATGKVMGKSAGNTYLYCTDSSGAEVKCLLKITVDPLSIRYGEKTVSSGGSFQFTATGGTGGYTWRTGNTDIATVDSTGKVTGKAVGNTYLYCKDSSGAEVKCLLKVIAPLSIRYGEKIVTVGIPFQFTATGGSGTYTWRTGNTSVATVDSTGKVTGKAAGNTYLYCRDSYGNEVKCLLKVIAPLSIRYGEKIVTVGIPFQFTATGGSGTYTWRTGNSAVATVDATGKVTGVSEGNTYLYCRDSYGIEGKCLLRIVSDPLSIRYSEKTVSVGETFQFSATGGSGTYTWRVGNTSVATVDSTGKVTGKSAGNTYLYCRDSYGNEVKCLLKIK